MALKSYKKMIKKELKKLPIYIDVDTLDMYCEYLLNYNNRTITYANLSNLNEYIRQMDVDKFRTTDSKYFRYLFIYYYLDAKLNQGVNSIKLVLKHIENNVNETQWEYIKSSIIDSIPHNEMSKSDVIFVNNMIYNQLNTIFMHGFKDAMMQILEDLNTNEFGKNAEDCDNAISLFQTILNELTKVKRRSQVENRFNLSDPATFNAMMFEAANRAISDGHFLQTGWQGLNKMLGGGFEDARLYNFIGATGGFKSGLLLNLMKEIKLYNKGRDHKDPTKRPTILFISQENNIWETFLRIYGIFGELDDIKKKTVAEIMESLRKGGFRIVDDDDDIDIEFRYYGNMEVSVPDLRGVVEEIDATGREVICIIQDYIERLRPPHLANSEKRNQLADVSNQLHDLAIELDIPIITASQFNREGVAILEAAQEKGHHDTGKLVGSGNISESYAMLKNFDVNIAIVVEYDAKEDRFYLAFRALKFRGDDRNTLKYFLQPFCGNHSKIQLMDDINEPQPLYRLTMIEESMLNVSDDIRHINELTRTTKTGIDGMAPILGNAFETSRSDIPETTTSDPFTRNKNGFIILEKKPKRKKPTVLLDIPNYHIYERNEHQFIKLTFKKTS